MKDEFHRNPGVMTGTPTLVPSLYISDTDQALSFNGTTNSMSVPDSVSDSLNVVVGGAALEGFFNLPAIPGTEQALVTKVGSYALSIGADAKLRWTLVNGASGIQTISTTTIVPNRSYHVVCVYNGAYTGTPVFGNQTQGTLKLPIPADVRQGVSTGANNLQVSKETILEKGQLTSVVMDLVATADATSPEWIEAVVYQDVNGVPGALLGKSAPVLIQPTVRAWVTFPLSCNVYPGAVWLGFCAGSGFAEYNPISIGYEASGGNRRWRNVSVSDTTTQAFTGVPPDPFASTGSDLARFAVYANYTPTGRTGAEGKALIYLNGTLDSSASYTLGIGDSANALSFAPTLAVKLDDVSIWNKALTPVQVATHYAASGGVGVAAVAPPPGGPGLFGDNTYGSNTYGG